MKTAVAQNSGEQECESTEINESDIDMPIAKRTRGAQRARWQEHSRSVQLEQVCSTELQAPWVLNGEHSNNYEKNGETGSFHSNNYVGGQCSKSSTGFRENMQVRRVGVKVKAQARHINCVRNSAKGLQLRIFDYGMKKIHDKSQQWLKNHRKQNVFDNEERNYIQELIKVEVHKQIMQFMNVIPVGNKKRPSPKNVRSKRYYLRNSVREEPRKSETRETKGRSQLSYVEEKELVVDLGLEEEEKFGNLVFEIIEGKERRGPQFKNIKRLEPVTKQGILETDKDYHCDETGFCMALEKVVEEKIENSVNNTTKQKKSKKAAVPVMEESDLPFQDLVLDTQKGEEIFSNSQDVSEDSQQLIVMDGSEAAADLDEMWKNMDLALKGDSHNLDNMIDISMAEKDKLKNPDLVIGEGNAIAEKDKLKNLDRDMGERHGMSEEKIKNLDCNMGEGNGMAEKDKLKYPDCDVGEENGMAEKDKFKNPDHDMGERNGTAEKVKLKNQNCDMCKGNGMAHNDKIKYPDHDISEGNGVMEKDKIKYPDHDMGEGNGMEEKDKLKNLDHDMGEVKEIQMPITKSEVIEFNKRSKDSIFPMEIKKLVEGNNANSTARKRKRRREPVLAVQETRSPFQCLLMNIQKEAEIPSKLENVFEDQKISEENNVLDDMWKDMELALKGNLLNSDSSMNSRNPEDLSEAEIDVPDIFCMGEHAFALDEEIGIVCSVCNFVKQEIGGIFPSLIVEAGGKRKRWDYDVEIPLYLTDLYSEDHGESSSFELLCPTEHSVWNLIPNLKENMYTHQQEGFEFLWRNLGGGLIPEKIKPPTSEEVGGCIISHAPGTGKTFLIISFLRTYLEFFPRSRPLIIAPFNMLLPWEREFKKWGVDIPVYMLNRSKTFWKELCSNDEHTDIVHMGRGGNFRGRRWKNMRRLVMLNEWHKRKSVLAVSYNLFVYLTCGGKHIPSQEAQTVGKLLLESPGILILDEGHQARNNQSKIWKSLKKVKTKQRIILSGTLFQNNFRELFNTLYVVRPTFVDRFLGRSSRQSICPSKVIANNKSHKEPSEENENRLRKLFMDEIGNKIQNGKEEFNQTLVKFRIMTDDFVHYYEGRVLNSLPGLRDFAIILRPSSIQQTILDQINLEDRIQRLSNFEYETMISCVSIHPSLYRDFGYRKLSGVDIPHIEAIRKDPRQGVKAKFVLDLVQLSRVIEEKVLLFSQNIPPLAYMVEMFEMHFSWRKGKEIFQLDGTLPLDERQSIIDQFNDPNGEARVLCASIKTCSEGISLTGASRVVFLDLVWNPSIVKQAVSRAFRLGQKKHVYVYRLLASGTMEEEKYQRTVWKDCLSKLIFVSPDDGDPSTRDNKQTIHCEDKILDKLVELDRETNAFNTIFEHSELKGRKDTRSDYFKGYYNLKEKFPVYVPS